MAALFALVVFLHSRAKCPSSPQLKQAPFFFRGGLLTVAAFALVHLPRLGALDRADVSMGTGTLFQALGAFEELYWGRGGGAVPVLWKKGRFCGGLKVPKVPNVLRLMAFIS